MQILGAQPHDRVCTLLAVALAHVHLQHHVVGFLIRFQATVEQMHWRMAGLDRESTQPSGEASGRYVLPSKSLWHVDTPFDGIRRGRGQPRIGRDIAHLSWPRGENSGSQNQNAGNHWCGHTETLVA